MGSSGDLARKAAAVSQHLALGAVAVVGAGLSISSRFPLTSGLNTLLWDALDVDSAARATLAAALGKTDGPSKGLVGDRCEDAMAACETVADSPAARTRFQRQFAVLDAERSVQPSAAHEALARLVHAGVVECVVSLNWDTALEKAYARLYGVAVPQGVLLKPHGDAARPEVPWTLPHEPGLVPSSVTEMVSLLAVGHARTLMVVGYSERDQVVVDQLLKPLDKSWRTVRVGPAATGEDDLPAGADEALPLLAEPFARREDDAAWHSVTYAGSRDIHAALAGERLGPRDVDACPELAEVDVLVRALRTDHAVVLNGPPGSGKSITAYHALRRIAHEGFETLRLRDDARGRGLRSWLADLAAFPRPKVLLLDDAQDMSPDTVRELAERADADTLVLVVGIDHVAGGVRTVRLGAHAAVARLAWWVGQERRYVFPLVHALDHQVGAHPNDLFFDRRVDIAERQQTPWQFFYTLTGGWRRMHRAALELRDHDRADLALLAVAVAHIASVDSGVARESLTPLAALLDRDDAWLDRSLYELARRRLVVDSEGRLRCAHLQSAYTLLAWMLHTAPLNSPPPARPAVPPIASAAAVPTSTPPTSTQDEPVAPELPRAEKDADRDAVCALVAAQLDSPETPLRGCTWLSGKNLYGDTRLYLRWKGVLGKNRDVQLAQRALTTPADGDVAAAAQLLSETVSYSKGEILDTVKEHDPTLRSWYATISPENAWALGDLANSLYNEDERYAGQVASYADPARLATLVLDGGWPHISSTSHALDRLCTAGGQPVRDAVQAHLDADSYIHMIHDGNPELWQTVALVDDLAAADHRLALQLFERAAPRLAQQFATDPVRHWNDMFQCVLHLGYGPGFLRRYKHPPAYCRRAARAFTSALDHDRIAEALAGPTDQWGQLNFHDFVDFLFEADPTKFAAVADLVDMAQFEQSLRHDPEAPGQTALYVAAVLWEHHPSDLHAIIDRLEPDWKKLDSLVAYMAPDIAIRALQRGLPLDLRLDHHHWQWAAIVLSRLHDEDPAIATEVAHANRETMVIGLTATNTHDPWGGLRHWTAACDRVAPGLLDEVIAELPEGAVTGWARALRRPRRRQRSRRTDIAPLVHRATQAGGHVRAEATVLLARYPSLRHDDHPTQ